MKSILIIEDQASTAHFLKRYLEQAGYQVFIAYRGKETLEIIDQRHINLVLLDLMLPDMDGMCLCQELRKQDASLPIVIVSAVGETGSKVQALHTCADDYIVKPFDMDEVLERINVQFRHILHMHSGADKQYFVADPLIINFEQRLVLINDQEINLTHKEYELLYVLAINNGKIVTYDFLLAKVWDDEYTSEYQSIHTYVNRLRKKIETPAQRRFIYNEPRIGYRFKADDKVR